MFKEYLAYLGNHMWRQSLVNIGRHLSPEEVSRFTNNDYYHISIIHGLGQPTAGQLAESLSLTKPAITAIVRKLSLMGLVEKVPSQIDGRVTHLKLTDKGRAIVEGDEHLYAQIEGFFKNIVDDDALFLRIETALGNLIETLKDEDGHISGQEDAITNVNANENRHEHEHEHEQEADR